MLFDPVKPAFRRRITRFPAETAQKLHIGPIPKPIVVFIHVVWDAVPLVGSPICGATKMDKDAGGKEHGENVR